MTVRDAKLFSKELSQLRKYDWLTACGFHTALRDKSRVLRLCNALMQCADHDSNIAFPTQETLAALANMADTGQVRKAISDLRRVKAISTVRISMLTAQELDQNPDLRKRNKRGLVYRLNLFWAYETIAAHSFKLKNPDREANREIAARFTNRTEPDRYERAEPDRYNAVSNRPANPSRNTTGTLAGAQDGEVHYGCGDTIRTREAVNDSAQDTTERTPSQNNRHQTMDPENGATGEKARPEPMGKSARHAERVGFGPITPPSSDREAIKFLLGRGVRGEKIVEATRRLMTGDLSEFDLEGMLVDTSAGEPIADNCNDIPTDEAEFGSWVRANIPDPTNQREAFRLLREKKMTPEILRRLAA